MNNENKIVCFRCKSSKKQGLDLTCFHPYKTGRVAVNARWYGGVEEWRYVSGRDEDKCSFFESNNESKDTPSLNILFPFEYLGGGYFRRKGVAKYVKAEVLHGMEAVEYLYEKIKIEDANKRVNK